MRYIADFRDGDRVNDIYLCKDKKSQTTKTGKQYYSLRLYDKTGDVDAKIWDINNAISDFDAPSFIFVDGEVTLYNGQYQLKIYRLRPADPSEYDVSELVPSSRFDVEKMYAVIMKFVESIENEYLRALAKSFFDDPQFAEAFKRHTAAKAMHHNFAGGLLEHTMRVVQLCDFYCRIYTTLYRDLLITGALCHDIGKLRELNDFPAADYSDEGQLIGHITIGYCMVQEKISKIDNFPKTLSDQLGHLMLSHHGELEFGSPKKPELIEAFALSHADNTDAKMEQVRHILSAGVSENEWVGGYNKILETYLRKTTKYDPEKK